MSFHTMNVKAIARFNSAESSDFLDAYTNTLNTRISKKNQPHRTFAASSIRCPRISWFRLRGTEPDTITHPDSTLEFFARMGDECHIYIQRVLYDMLGSNWIDVEDYIRKFNIFQDYSVTHTAYETQIELSDPPIRFACDGIAFWRDLYRLIEIKSVDHATFEELTGPLEKHIDQFRCYSTLLELYGGFFLYIDRMYGDVKCYETIVSDQEKSDIRNMFSSVMKYAKYGVIPDALPHGDPWCTPSMCNYYKKCLKYGR